MKYRYTEDLFFETVKSQLNIDYRSILALNDTDEISSAVDSVRDVIFMKIIKAVDSIHKYSVYQDASNRSRWCTYIFDKATGKRRKIQKKTKEELYKYLYTLYFGELEKMKMASLKEVYSEWLEYKISTVNRINTAKRLDQEYHKYYLDEPLAKDILEKPLISLKKMDIETWAYGIIKKYDMTRKKFVNVFTVLRQVMDYMVAKEAMDINTCTRVKINSNLFRKTRKKPANTQIFYPDELELVVEKAFEMADKTGDESFLAIPLLKLTGVRIAECLGLTFDDFDRKENIVHVHRSFAVIETFQPDGTWATRSYKVIESLKQNADPRDVLISDETFEVVDMIHTMLKNKGCDRPFLFEVRTPMTIEKKVYKICDDLEIPRRSVHKFRKTYVSNLLNSGMDPDFVRTQVGHQDIQTTYNSYVYSNTRNAQKIAQLNAIS